MGKQQFAVRVTQAQREKLDYLADLADITAGAVLRRLIDASSIHDVIPRIEEPGEEKRSHEKVAA